MPQLLNVLRGDMSVIGPRPGLAYQLREYTPFQRRRLTVLPGITGWAQVNGRNAIAWDQRIVRDVEYVERLSFAMDLRILLRTVRAVLDSSSLLAERDYFKARRPSGDSRRNVVIIGAGDHGRGALEILREARPPRRSARGARLPRRCAGETRADARRTAGAGRPRRGSAITIVPASAYVIGIADTRIKQAIVERVGDWSVSFVSLVHPPAFVAHGVRIAPGALINAGATIAYDTMIEEHTTVNLNATVGHDCVLGRFSTVAPGANIAGRVRLGEGCDVGLNATVGKGLEIGEWSRSARARS